MEVNHTNIPVRFMGVSLDDIEKSDLPPQLLDYADRWVEEVDDAVARYHEQVAGLDVSLARLSGWSISTPTWGLLLSGAPGVGKSWLTAALLNYAFRSGIDQCFWISAQNLISAYYRKMELGDIINKLSTLDDNTPELVEKRERDQHLWWLRNECKVLVIDDLGRERETASGFVSGMLDEVIRTRVDNGLCTHITTNLLLTKGQIADRYGEPLESLLKEVTKAFEWSAEDFRNKIYKERE